MKTYRHSLIQYASIILILGFGLLASCKNPTDQASTEAIISDTVFQEGVDTIIIFDPETLLETVEIRKFSDTLVNGQSLRSSRFSNE